MSLGMRGRNGPVLNDVIGMTTDPIQKKAQTDPDTQSNLNTSSPGEGPPARSRTDSIQGSTTQNTTAKVTSVVTHNLAKHTTTSVTSVVMSPTAVISMTTVTLEATVMPPTAGTSPTTVSLPTNVTSPTTVTSAIIVTSPVTHSTCVMTKVLASQVVVPHVETMGLSVSQQTILTAELQEHKWNSSSRSSTRALKNIPENHYKSTSRSHTGATTWLTKKTTQMVSEISMDLSKIGQVSLSQIPRTVSSPAFTPGYVTAPSRGADVKGCSREGAVLPTLTSADDQAHVTAKSQSQQQEGTHHSTTASPERGREQGEEKRSHDGQDPLQDMHVQWELKGSDLTLQPVYQCPLSPCNRKQLSPGATAPPTTCLKGTVCERDTNSRRQRERERERDMEGRERQHRGQELLEEYSSQEPVEYKRQEERRRVNQKNQNERAKGEEETRWKERENEDKGRQEEAGKISKSFRDAAADTAGNTASLRTADAGSQTELGFVNSAVQAVVEVSSKSTAMSPTMAPRPLSWLSAEPDPNYVSLNGSLDSDWLSSHTPVPTARPKCLSPDQSPISCKSPQHHVCQIQIELCSHTPLPDSPPPVQVPESKVSPASHSGVASQQVRMGEQAKMAPPPGVVMKEKVETARLKGVVTNFQADMAPPPGVVWDEQGMTWEVYGAAVDTESLGFAIQSYLQRRIQEHIRHMGALRRSISLSERSDAAGSRKKRRNIFRALFHVPACCSRARAEMAQ